MVYETSYSAADIQWGLSALTLLAVLLTGAGLHQLWRGLQPRDAGAGEPPRLTFFFAIALTVFGGCFYFTLLPAHAQVREAREILESGQCQIVEGRVQGYRWGAQIAPHSKLTRFEVSGVRFLLGDVDLDPGMSPGSMRGGPIRNGMMVRICEHNGSILKFEIAKT